MKEFLRGLYKTILKSGRGYAGRLPGEGVWRSVVVVVMVFMMFVLFVFLMLMVMAAAVGEVILVFMLHTPMGAHGSA